MIIINREGNHHDNMEVKTFILVVLSDSWQTGFDCPFRAFDIYVRQSIEKLLLKNLNVALQLVK